MQKMFLFVWVILIRISEAGMLSSVTTMEDMLTGATLSTLNYDALLTGWASLPTLQSDVVFDAGDSIYDGDAVYYYNILVIYV